MNIFFKQFASARSWLIAALFCIAPYTLEAVAKQRNSCPISITTIAESSPGCSDGAIVVDTTPSEQEVRVSVNPGDFEFNVTTPATLRPEGTPGFAAGNYTVKVDVCGTKSRLKKCVTISVARFSVTVPPVTDATCGCTGAFKTIFNNPDNADVTVTFLATSGGTIIGTSGDYTNLCPGTYDWTVQANSKSPACNKKVVFKQSGTVVIDGSASQKPLVILNPPLQTVPTGGSAFFNVTTNVSGPGVSFILTDPQGNTHTNTTGQFVITPAIAGSYTAVVVNNGCPSDPSTPAIVQVGGCLPFSLTPSAACSKTPVGSITVDVSDHTPPFTFSVNGGTSQTALQSPFTISNLAGNASYTITVTDATGCSGTGGPVFIPLLPTPPDATLAPASQQLVTGGTLTFIAGPTGLGSNCIFQFTVPNPNRGVNGIIIQPASQPQLVLTNATSADLGSYSVLLDCGGCPSDPAAPVFVVTPGCSLVVSNVVATSSCSSPNPGSGSLTITVQGGTPPYFYSADGVNFSQPTSNTTTTISNLAPGTYNNITVKDSSTPQCSAVGPSTTINALALPTVSITGTSFVPLGATLALQAIAPTAVSFSWTGPSNFTASTAAITIFNASAANAGVYTVTVVDQFGCINQASFSVAVGLAPVLEIRNASSKKICTGTCTSFTVTVKNTGAAIATNLVLTDTFPTCINIQSVQGAGWTIRTTGSGFTATLPSLAQGAKASVTVNVSSNCVGTFESVATVVSNTTPSVSSTATITGVCCPNLRC